MLKREGFLTIATCAVLALLGILSSGRECEPTYKGKPLSYWVHVWNDYLPGDDGKQQAERAIRAMGANALPYLLHWMRSEPRFRITYAESLLLKVPFLKSKPWFDEWVYRLKKEEKADDTIHVFGILDSSVAQSAVPPLTAYLNNTSLHYTAMRAAQSLGVIGDIGMPPLLQALADPRHKMSQPIMCALCWTPPSGTNAVRAVHLLFPHTQDRDPMVAQTAVHALGAIAAEAEATLPVLSTTLKSKDPEVRKAAASSIGKFGMKAYPAISALVAVLDDVSPEVRSSVTNALKEIAPQIFADANP